MKKRQATLKDIAKAIGVSASTVSRALNDHPAISITTKNRIKAKAKELNYEPNIVALSLKSRSTKTIGVVIPELIHFFFSSVISGIEEVAYSRGYTVMVCKSNESHDKEVKDTMALLAHQVDGLLMSHARDLQNTDHYQEILDREVPLVFFDRAVAGIDVPRVVINDQNAAYEATKHLIDQGRTQPIHLGNNLDMPLSASRVNGYKRALEEAKIKVDDSRIIDCPNNNHNDCYLLVKEMLEKGVEMDAIFASNDQLAIGAIKAIKSHGLSVPKDVAVVGFSNWNFCDMVEPPLSSVDQPGLEMGKVAATRLLDLIHSNAEPKAERIVLDTKLIIRASSKA